MTDTSHSVGPTQFRSASRHDVSEVITWVDSSDQLRFWAGPGLSFPINLSEFLERIYFSSDNAFVCEDRCGLAAFAQLLTVQPSRLHLARLITHPRTRGQGIGRYMSQCLISEAKRRHATCVTLKVYASNRRAINLYRSLGFQVSPEIQSNPVLEMELSLDESADNQGPGV